MEQEIINELKNLEATLEIKILYAVESGSRAWGFASTDSDWDVRFIYVHKPEWYLSIDDKKDSFEKILPNDIDLGGWEVRKALKLFNKSNPPLMEWLWSPIVHLENGDFAHTLRDLSANYFNPRNGLHHYLHMAEGNFRNYLQKEMVRTKKYFYVLRPLLACQWIAEKQTMPPTEFSTTFGEFIHDGKLKSEIENLLQRKIAGEELGEEPKIETLHHYLESSISYFQALVKSFPASRPLNNIPLNNLFRHSLKTAWYNNFS